MKSIQDELIKWAMALPFWERAALDMVVSGVQFTDAHYDELLQYLLEDEGLAEQVSTRRDLKFFGEKKEIFPSESAKIRLVKIQNLQNVNALALGQIMTFGPALTVIFGENRSGKSGYSRILGCAGFTRGDRKVLPDVMKPYCPSLKSSADIEIFDGTYSKIINYIIGDYCPELSSFYVFDSTSVNVHLTKSNTFSFSPVGLSYLTQLTEVTDRVRQQLMEKINPYKREHNFGNMFPEETAVSDLINRLSPEMNVEELEQLLNKLKKLAFLTPEEGRRLSELETEIVGLKTKNVSKQISKLDRTITDLKNLIIKMREIERQLEEESINKIRDDIKNYCKAKLVAQDLSIDRFKSKYLSKVGSQTWFSFVEAAKKLAETLQKKGKPYPQVDDHCLLCQQQLTPDARKLLLSLWEFLEGEAQQNFEDAKEKLLEEKKNIKMLDLEFFSEESIYHSLVEKFDNKTLVLIKKFITTCKNRHKEILRNIQNLTDDHITPMPNSIVPDIQELIKKIREEKNELSKSDLSEEISELEMQYIILKHRIILQKNIYKIEDYTNKLIWAKKAVKIGGSTRHITQKHNELFDKLVTDRYIELFEQILRDLKRPLKITVKTLARKGETYKQIVLETDPTIPHEMTDPEDILCEGEKRAVAFADFITEAQLDTNNCGIILDDPATSLDLVWERTIASILVEQAKSKQVIIFTHYLPFLSFIKEYADQESVEMLTHWIKRGDSDDKPGYVFINNSPAIESEYKTSARAHEIYKRALGASAREQEDLLYLGFDALRSSYEAFIVFDIFNQVVKRFDERISVERLKEIVWEPSIIDNVIEKNALISRYIGAHLHSDDYGGQKPSCRTLLEEINAFDALKNELKRLKSKSRH